jgi:ABC-type uncharacterized transport system YnjBCD ATPase subunit
MYLVEGGSSDGFDSFESIPIAMYWAVVTITTIGRKLVAPPSFLMLNCAFSSYVRVRLRSQIRSFYLQNKTSFYFSSS